MIEKVLTTIAIATGLVVLGHLVGWRPWEREDGPERGDWGAILGVAAAVAASQAFLESGLPDFPPGDATTWLFWLSGGAALVALVGAYVGKAYVVWPLRVLLVGGGGYLLAAPLMEHAWSGADGWLRVAVFTAATLVVWAGADRLVDRRPDDSTVPLGIAVAVAAGAGVISYVSSITIGLLAAALALGLGATVVTMWLRADVSARGVLGVFVPLVGFVYFVAHGYAEIGALPTTLLATALLLPWAGELVADRSVWVRGALRVILAVLPVAVAAPIAESALNAESESQEADEDGSYVPY